MPVGPQTCVFEERTCFSEESAVLDGGRGPFMPTECELAAPGGRQIRTILASRTGPDLQLYQRGVAQHEGLGADRRAEVDLRLRVLAEPGRRHHRAEAEAVVANPIPRG
jgi:hypothetical protein